MFNLSAFGCFLIDLVLPTTTPSKPPVLNLLYTFGYQGEPMSQFEFLGCKFSKLFNEIFFKSTN